jgi:DNA mismatch repair protein MutL
VGKIKVLPLSEVWKIAAGEVVERPSSVVKELVENSLDAGATSVTVFIEGAGKKLIRILDNGFGMGAEDAKASVLPHATSKISTVEDLFKVKSFGFRGEALASIVAVSKLTISTKETESDLGVELSFLNGALEKEEAISREPGTDISVADLFLNTPARRKFLKQDETEWNQIQQLIYALAINNKSVHFKLVRDGKQALNSPPVSLLSERLCQVWCSVCPEDFLSIKNESSGITVEGLVTNARSAYYGRHRILVFVNGRFVKNGPFIKSIVKGYSGALPPGKYPTATIFISLEQSNVDINVHPRKEEVRFSSPGKVEKIIEVAVQRALEAEVSDKVSTNDFSYQSQQSKNSEFHKFNNRGEIANEFLPASATFLDDSDLKVVSEVGVLNKFDTLPVQETLLESKPFVVADSFEQQMASPLGVACEPAKARSAIVGQIFDTYILVEKEGVLMLVDQHAAHERILYERMKGNFEEREGVRLMFPEMIDVSKEQIHKVMEAKKTLEAQGILLEQFGPTQIVINALPPGLQAKDAKELLFECLSLLEENDDIDSNEIRKIMSEHMHSHLACKTAIKAGDKLSVEQMERVLDDLGDVENRFQCIHGRPTMWEIEKKQIEKWFRRR